MIDNELSPETLLLSYTVHGRQRTLIRALPTRIHGVWATMNCHQRPKCSHTQCMGDNEPSTETLLLAYTV